MIFSKDSDKSLENYSIIFCQNNKEPTITLNIVKKFGLAEKGNERTLDIR